MSDLTPAQMRAIRAENERLRAQLRATLEASARERQARQAAKAQQANQGK